MSTYKESIDKIKPELDKSFKFLETEVAKLHTGRATPSLVEDITVDAFGSKFALKQLGAISSPQSNQIVIQPWDISYIEPIEKAISLSGLGMSAIVDKDIIRLNLPLLTEEYRQVLVKTLNEKAEQTRKTIRHWREDAWNEIQQSQKDKKISEDDKFRGKDELQKVIDDYTEKIKNLIERKKKELI
ncbi:MAG: ribosome recycling factor [Patescibacteria group bacterium]